ncbi:MAG TPA: ribosome maturation factor RimP [Actinomycetota bacterium]|nr:ribosome maturation factor RimP [Actinomycetota bacterium]
MTRTETMPVVHDICESVALTHGLELVEVRLSGGGRNRILLVTLDRLEGPISLGDLTKVSEEISRALDVEDPIEGSYVLEVSSAGLERPLVKPSDYQRFAGREVKVKLERPLEGRRNFQGTVASSNDRTFVLDLGSEVVEIPYSEVARTKLVVDWDQALKGAPVDLIEEHVDTDEMAGGSA